MQPLFVTGTRSAWTYPQTLYECQECKQEMKRCCQMLNFNQPQQDFSIYKHLGNYSRVCRDNPIVVDNTTCCAPQMPYPSIRGPLYQEGSVLQDESKVFINNETRAQRYPSKAAATTDVKDIANAYLREFVERLESRPMSPDDIGCPPIDVLKRVVDALRELQDCDIDNIIKDIRHGKMGISKNDIGSGQSPVHAC